jgi:predicted MFS family arabinose efflux permease
VLLLDATPQQMGLLVMLQTLPTLAVSLFAGVLVDRVRRRPIMVGGDLIRAALLMVIPIAAWRGSISMVHLYVVSAALGSVTVVSRIAARAYLPWLLPPTQILRANSRLEVSRSITQVAGPGLGGTLVQLLGAPIALVTDAITLVVGAAFFASIRAKEPKPEPHDRHVFADIRRGLRIVLTHAILRPIVLCGASHNFCSQMIVALQILYMNRVLGLHAYTLGLLFSAAGPGALLGAAMARRIAERLGTGRTLVLSQVLTGVARIAIPLAVGPRPVVIVILVASEFLLGFARPLFNVTQISLRQRAVEPALQGRVNASFSFLLWGLPPLGAALGGQLGAAIGMRPTLAIAATGVLAATLWIRLSAVYRNQ